MLPSCWAYCLRSFAHRCVSRRAACSATRNLAAFDVRLPLAWLRQTGRRDSVPGMRIGPDDAQFPRWFCSSGIHLDESMIKDLGSNGLRLIGHAAQSIGLGMQSLFYITAIAVIVAATLFLFGVL